MIRSREITNNVETEPVDIDYVIDLQSNTVIDSDQVNSTYVYTIISANDDPTNRFKNYVYDIQESIVYANNEPKATLQSTIDSTNNNNYRIDNANVYSDSNSANKVIVALFKDNGSIDDTRLMNFVGKLDETFNLNDISTHDNTINDSTNTDAIMYYFKAPGNSDKPVYKRIASIDLKYAFTDYDDPAQQEIVDTNVYNYLPVVVAIDEKHGTHSVYVDESINYTMTSTESNWSNVNVQQAEELVAPTSSVQSDGWGASVLSSDGSHMVVYGNSSTAGEGQVIVYKRNNNEYTQFADLSLSGLGQIWYAKCADISHDGTFVIVSGYATNGNSGRLDVYKRNNTNYDLVQTVTKDNTGAFGTSCAISPDGNFVCAGGPNNASGGTVYVFKKINNAFSDFDVLSNTTTNNFGALRGVFERAIRNRCRKSNPRVQHEIGQQRIQRPFDVG